MNRFHLERVIKAPLSVVWNTADFTKPVGHYRTEMITPGDPDNHQVGYTRAVSSGGRTIVERLLSVNPQTSYTYTLIEGVPIKSDYLGQVAFVPKGNDTKIIWTASFTPRFFGTGWFGAIMIRRTVNQIIDYIESESMNAASADHS